MKKIILTASVLAALPSVAQVKELDEISINGRTKVKQERGEFKRHGQSVEILSEAEINRNNPAFLEQSLGTVAGVQVDKRTALGGQRVVIRGYGNDQKFNNWGIKQYLNGAPVTAADGVGQIDDIDFSLVNGMEVIKGPAATMYGGGAGGVARFYIRPSEEKGLSMSQNTMLGSNQHQQSSSRINYANDQVALLFNYSHISTQGYRPHGYGGKNFYTFLGDFKINSKQKLSVHAAHTFSHDKVAGQIPFADYYAGIDLGNTAYIRKDAGNKMLSQRFSVGHQAEILPNLSLSNTVFFSHLDIERVAAGAMEYNMSPNYGIRSVISLKNELAKDWQNGLELGAELQQSRNLVSNYRFSGSLSDALQVRNIGSATYFKIVNNQSSVFVIDKLTYKPWEITLLMGSSLSDLSYTRKDLFDVKGFSSQYTKKQSFDKSFDTAFNPHIALQKTIAKQIINVSYSEGFNAPTSGMAFSGDLDKPNDRLLPERAKMWDASIHGLVFNSKLDYQISAYQIDYGNKLSQLSEINPLTKTRYSYWGNTGSQRNRGLEGSIAYNYTSKTAFFSRITPFANASYVEAQYINYQAFVKDGPLGSNKLAIDYSGKQVVGVPRHKSTLGLDLETRFGLYANATFNHMGTVYTDFANSNKMESFNLLNAKLGYKVSLGRFDIDAFVMGNNLSNHINYSFLFLGANIGDSDPDSNFGAAKTDVTPGPSKAYFFGGLNVKYRIF